jgi:hypothetical protein
MIASAGRVLLGLALVAVAHPALAHHSFAAEFDGTKPVTLHGTITMLEWANPHGWIHIAVKGEDGAVVNWAVETAGPNALARRGVRRSDLPLGIEITVKGYRAKNGTPTANASTVMLPDGRELIAASSGTGGPTDAAEKPAK